MIENIFKDEVAVPKIIGSAALKSLPRFLSSTDSTEITQAVLEIARAFGDYAIFDALVLAPSSEREHEDKKLILSFQKNVHLLVQKTWVEDADEEVKEETLYQIEHLCTSLLGTKDDIVYAEILFDFIKVLRDIVYLLFGSQIAAEDFAEYAIRVDPDFGLFWYYTEQVAHFEIVSEEKARLVILLAMFFLANF